MHTLLTDYQRELIDAHLDVVKWTVHCHITVNENIYGFSRDDLYQEGYIWLCRAARTYDDTKSQFRTYAQTVVKNGLVDYCRRMCAVQKRQVYLQDTGGASDEEHSLWFEQLAAPDEIEPYLSRRATLDALETAKHKMSGVARLGVEALELKIKGYSGAEIAKMYGVKANHVGAWISRAAQKLRQNEAFMAEFR